LRHINGPQGVRGRNSDNRRLRELLGWEPSVTLREGLAPTYSWIEKQVASCDRSPKAAARQANGRPDDPAVSPMPGIQPADLANSTP
jgi:hypothetical protein